MAVLALGAGLLSSVLTPCLLQLVVVFGGVIAGFLHRTGAPPRGRRGPTDAGDPAQDHATRLRLRARLSQPLRTGGRIYTEPVGHQAQLAFSEYSRMVAVISGLLVILLGLWVGFRGTRDFACRIPDRQAMNSLSLRDRAGALLTLRRLRPWAAPPASAAPSSPRWWSTWAPIGSPYIGAAIMMIFGIGVAIPFLLSALVHLQGGQHPHLPRRQRPAAEPWPAWPSSSSSA